MLTPPMADKALIQKYLESSGIACASICPGGFLENLTRGCVCGHGPPISPSTYQDSSCAHSLLGCPFEETETAYIYNTYEPEGCRLIQTWIGRDMGLAVTALFTQYDARAAAIDHQTFVLGCRRATTEEVAAELAEGAYG